MKMGWRACLVLALAGRAGQAAGAEWAGEWLTDFGVLVLRQDGAAVRGDYGPQQAVEGKALGKTLKLSFRDGRSSGEAQLDLGADGASFRGTRREQGGQSGGEPWRGWRIAAEAQKGKAADFSGVWRSSLGMVVLEQKGEAVKGSFGCQGWGSVEGMVKGRRLELTWKRLEGSGRAWTELTPDLKSFFGKTEETPFTRWLGQKLEGHARKAKPKPGEVVGGLAANSMCY